MREGEPIIAAPQIEIKVRFIHKSSNLQDVQLETGKYFMVVYGKRRK